MNWSARFDKEVVLRATPAAEFAPPSLPSARSGTAAPGNRLSGRANVKRQGGLARSAYAVLDRQICLPRPRDR